MTRFARAKGSKASNEKQPEAATSWGEMKRELLNKNKELVEKQNREAALKKRQENYQAFLRETEEEQARKTTWAEFPEASREHGKQSLDDDESEESDGQFSALKTQIEQVLAKDNDNSDDEAPDEVGSKKKPEEIVIKKIKKPKQKLKILVDKEDELIKTPKKAKKRSLENLTEKQQNLVRKKLKRESKQMEKKKLKRQAKREAPENLVQEPQNEATPQPKDEATPQPKDEATQKTKAEKKLERRKRQKEKLKMKRAQNNQQKSIENTNTINKQEDDKKKFPQQKKAKPRDNKQHNSRKAKPEKLFINGKTVEIDYVDGFPVKKEDSDRLRKLRKEMVSKGLPRSEINAALKLERRRAEKAFAREKKSVCFNCRKSGHNLSECPELNKDQAVQSTGTGICFKCGSTEHTHFECKVVKGLDYKFATCFICKEQGHIAKQCPDNQRGLYPKGGSCKVCGDVTHLKKDCPKHQAHQAQIQNSLSIGTLDDGNPEDFEGKGSLTRGGKRLNKVIKF